MVNTLTNNKIDICRSDLLRCCLGEILGKKYLKSGEKIIIPLKFTLNKKNQNMVKFI